MVYIAIGTAYGLFLFLCVIKAYSIGFKHGKQVSNGIIPTNPIAPVKTLKQVLNTKEIKKQDDLTQQGIYNVANFDPYKVEKE